MTKAHTGSKYCWSIWGTCFIIQLKTQFLYPDTSNFNYMPYEAIFFLISWKFPFIVLGSIFLKVLIISIYCLTEPLLWVSSVCTPYFITHTPDEFSKLNTLKFRNYWQHIHVRNVSKDLLPTCIVIGSLHIFIIDYTCDVQHIHHFHLLQLLNLWVIYF